MCFLLNNISFSQELKSFYEKGIESTLKDLINQHPNDKYYLQSSTTINDMSKNYFDGFDCDIDLSSFEQSLTVNNIKIPEKFRKYFVKNNFLNRVIYGKKLKKMKISTIYSNNINFLLKTTIYGKEDAIILVVIFDKQIVELSICKASFIY